MFTFNDWRNTNEAVKEEGHWGWHLILDMSGIDIKAGKDKETIERFFKQLVPAIDMKAVGPLIIKYLIPEQSNAGYSALQLIETSDITFHIADKKGLAFLDVFSCKTFDPDIVINMAKQYFKPKKIRDRFIYRDAP